MVSSTEPTTSATSGDEIDGSGRSSAAHSTSGRRRKGAAGAETRTHWRAGELGVAGEPPERALGTSSEVPGLTSAHTRMATALKRLEVAIPNFGRAVVNTERKVRLPGGLLTRPGKAVTDPKTWSMSRRFIALDHRVP